MYDSKYSKVLTIILVVVVILIIALLIFWGINVIRNNKINSDSDEVIEAFKNNISTNNTIENTVTNNTVNNGGGLINPYENMVVENTVTDNTGDGQSLEGMMYKGFTMSGYIEIPKTGIKYPVLNEFNKKSLETSVAIMHGPGLNQVGNTVIAGHNYRNGVFFSDNAKLSIGDVVYITDASGTTVTYTIYKKYQTTPEDAEFVNRDTHGKREITLTTCNDDSQARIILWASAE